MVPTIDQLRRDLHQALTPPPDSQTACVRVCDILKSYARAGLAIPDCLRQTTSPCYARHLIHQEEGDGYCIVAMVWGPGQGTAVHDHGGTWCVEGCMEGQLAVTSYRLEEQLSPERVRMQQEDCIEVGPGSVGCLIPPYEHHKIHNPFEQTAITIHVYGKELAHCTRYLEEGEDVFRVESVPLRYTSRPYLELAS